MEIDITKIPSQIFVQQPLCKTVNLLPHSTAVSSFSFSSTLVLRNEYIYLQLEQVRMVARYLVSYSKLDFSPTGESTEVGNVPLFPPNRKIG